MMDLKYCNTCAKIRSMEIKVAQVDTNCDLCGIRAFCSSGHWKDLGSPEDAFNSKGYFNSNDLTALLDLVKKRKSVLIVKIKILQLSLSRPVAELSFKDSIVKIQDLAHKGVTKRNLQTASGMFEKICQVADDGLNGDSDRPSRVVILHNLQAELSGLEEREKNLNILYKNALDQILIQKVRLLIGDEEFKKLFERAKQSYHQINRKGV